MQNKKVIILIVLGIGAFFSLLYGIITPSKVKREFTSISNAVRQDIKGNGIEVVSTGRRAKRTSFTSWGRNPFSIHGGALEGLRLTGIMWDEVIPMAMINDNIFKIGDKLGGYTIVDITPHSVILEKNGKRHTLE